MKPCWQCKHDVEQHEMCWWEDEGRYVIEILCNECHLEGGECQLNEN